MALALTPLLGAGVCGPGASAQDAPAGEVLTVVAVQAEAQPLLRREGDFVVDRPARLVELADGALAAVFEPAAPAAPIEPDAGVSEDGFLAAPPPPEPVPTLPPMVLQPSRLLDALREVRLAGQADARFGLSGRVQRYRGRNHLLLSGFEGLRATPVEEQPQAAEDGASQAPPAAAAGSVDGATAAVEDLMASMDADARSPDERPPGPGPSVEPPAVAGNGPGWRDGALVNRRLGRLVTARGEGSLSGSVFVFDSGDPPLRVLPGAVAERAEDLVWEAGEDLLFELSGQVSLSGREAWVLPAALRWRPDAGRVDDPAGG